MLLEPSSWALSRSLLRRQRTRGPWCLLIRHRLLLLQVQLRPRLGEDQPGEAGGGTGLGAHGGRPRAKEVGGTSARRGDTTSRVCSPRGLFGTLGPLPLLIVGTSRRMWDVSRATRRTHTYNTMGVECCLDVEPTSLPLEKENGWPLETPVLRSVKHKVFESGIIQQDLTFGYSTRHDLWHRDMGC